MNYEFLSLVIAQIFLQILLYFKNNATIKRSLERMGSSQNSGANAQLAQDIYTMAAEFSDFKSRYNLRKKHKRGNRETEDGYNSPREQGFTVNLRKSKSTEKTLEEIEEEKSKIE